MSNDKVNAQNTGTPYDDVYRTLIVDCPKLLIPVVNEIFHKKYDENIKIISLENELYVNQQDSKQMKLITDSHLMIESSRYHLECQSTIDNSILIRCFEYDSQIALQDSTLTNNTLTVNFPNTAILYLRHNQNTPDTMTVSIKVPGNECHYQVPVMKISTYSIDKIFEKKLYFLIPFHIFVYEKHFKEYNSNEQKLTELKIIYKQILQRLDQCAKQGLLTELNKHMIISMSKKVLNHISQKHEKIQKGIGDVMGGNVLDYEAKDIYRSGIAEGIAQGVIQGKNLGHTEKLIMLIQKKLDKGQTVEQISDALEESVEAIELLIKEYHLA